MTLYLLNSPVLTDYGVWRFTGPVSPEKARQWISRGYVSAVGHASSARLLSRIFSTEVSVARVRVSLQVGDQALVLRLGERLPEGAVLDSETLDSLPWELSLLERIE